MLTIILFIGMIALLSLMSIADHALESRKRAKELEYDKSREEFDEDGHKKVWDAHYTRALELEQGLNVARTRCDDVNCTDCYWKPSKLQEYSKAAFAPGSKLLTERQEFIKSLPDDMSDDLCELMYSDWEAERRDEIESAKQAVQDAREAKKREAMEIKYATPYEDILRFQAEGRTYDKTRGWSHIPNNKATPVTVLPNNDFQDKLEKVEADLRKALSPAHKEILDMNVRYEYDVKTGFHYRYITTLLKSGKKVVKREPVVDMPRDKWEW